MSHIYISYRAIDSHQKAIQQIYTYLADHYGADYVTLSPQDHALDTTIRQAQVQSHQILLVVFGRYGLNMVDERGNRLIVDPYDAQHIEISAALKNRLQIQTLVFDDMVEDLSKHIPEVLKDLAKKPVTLNMTYDTVPDTLETLVDDFGEVKPDTPPITQVDLSQMVVQPSTKPVHPLTPYHQSTSATHEPEIYIHQSRNPLMRFLRRFRRQVTGDAQSQYNNHLANGHSQVDNYRQMWPTSFLMIAVAIALAIAFGAVANTHIPDNNDADFNLREVAAMGRGAVDVAFSADGSQVAHITPFGGVYYLNWEIMTFPDRISVRMSSPEQLAYSIDNTLVMRNDSRIFVVNTRDFGGYLEHQYVIDRDATILDMAVSPTSPVIVFILDTGELIRWNYNANQIDSVTVVNEPVASAQLSVSEDLNLIAVYAYASYLTRTITMLSMDSLEQQYRDNASLEFITLDDEARMITLPWRAGTYTVWNTNNWSQRVGNVKNLYTTSTTTNFEYNSEINLLMQIAEQDVYSWLINDESEYLGSYSLDINDRVETFAISPDGRYLVTGTLTNTIIWELDLADDLN